jgi:GNAT superfamily N-acetyltransferase
MDAVIRRATIQDYDALCAIWAEVDSLHADALPHLFRRPQGPVRSFERVAELLADQNTAILAAELEDELVGVVTVVINTSAPHPIFVPRSWAVVEDICVSSSHRRRGIGQALMRAAHDWARQRGVADMELTVWEFNKDAREFYEALGYTTVRRRMSSSLE